MKEKERDRRGTWSSFMYLSTRLALHHFQNSRKGFKHQKYNVIRIEALPVDGRNRLKWSKSQLVGPLYERARKSPMGIVSVRESQPVGNDDFQTRFSVMSDRVISR